MRKLVIGLALASTAIATPAFARDDSWYLELDFGGMIVEDADLDIAGVNNAATLDTHTGYDGGAAIGYDFGGFRLETEASYRRAENDTINSVEDGTFSDRGHSSMLSFMVNGLLDFGPDDGIQGFVGGGVGVGRVDYRLQGVGSDSDTGFAWQALAGVRAPITKHWDAGLKYRFMNVDNVDVVLGGSDVSTRWRSHSLMAESRSRTSAVATISMTTSRSSPLSPPHPTSIFRYKEQRWNLWGVFQQKIRLQHLRVRRPYCRIAISSR